MPFPSWILLVQNTRITSRFLTRSSSLSSGQSKAELHLNDTKTVAPKSSANHTTDDEQHKVDGRGNCIPAARHLGTPPDRTLQNGIEEPLL